MYTRLTQSGPCTYFQIVEAYCDGSGNPQVIQVKSGNAGQILVLTLSETLPSPLEEVLEHRTEWVIVTIVHGCARASSPLSLRVPGTAVSGR